MVWGGISMEGHTDLCRLGNCTLTAIRYWDETLGLIIRSYILLASCGESEQAVLER